MIPKNIEEKRVKKLHLDDRHPLCIIKSLIYRCFGDEFFKLEDLSEVVSVEDNFDNLLVPIDHPSRSEQDTFYISPDTVLRTHTSAHQNELLCQGKKHFLVCGDVYRRDTIDRSHYPVFHQIEGVSICEYPERDLRKHLLEVIFSLFGDVEYRIVDSYFPFTTPSWEYEIKWCNEWLEVLGCGLVHPQILKNCGIEGEGWAFGLGLERLAMILFDIPDIRLFWSKDPRFLNQFQEGTKKFVPYSNYPICYKDVTFWLSPKFNYNALCEMVRDIAGDLVESVSLIDSYDKAGQSSHCYRISYRSMDRNLSNEEINMLQDRLRENLVKNFNVTLR